MRINIVFKKKNFSGFIVHNKNFINSLSSKKTNNFFFNEELNRETINELNNCDIIFARHNIKKEISEHLKVPVVIQNERLYLPRYRNNYFSSSTSLDHLIKKKNVFFLTDKIFENESKRFFSYPHLWKFETEISDYYTNPKKKDIDILFVSGHSYFNNNYLIKDFVNQNLNYFGNILQSSKEFYFKEKNFFLQIFQKILGNSKYSFHYFYEKSFHSLRFKRKQKILKELLSLSNNYNIAYYGINSNDQTNLLCRGYLEADKTIEIFQRSKVVICTTPCHLNMINERIKLALNTLTIPLVERYPQNIDLGIPANFFFDYKNDNLAYIIPLILNNYNEVYSEYLKFLNDINYEKYSLKKFFLTIIDLNKTTN